MAWWPRCHKCHHNGAQDICFLFFNDMYQNWPYHDYFSKTPGPTVQSWAHIIVCAVLHILCVLWFPPMYMDTVLSLNCDECSIASVSYESHLLADYTNKSRIMLLHEKHEISCYDENSVTVLRESHHVIMKKLSRQYESHVFITVITFVIRKSSCYESSCYYESSCHN